MQKIKFGTDGWRAVIADDFTFENVKIVAQAIACYLKKEVKNVYPVREISDRIERTDNECETDFSNGTHIIIGYDTRFMSDKYAMLIACVLAGNNIRVFLPKESVPTPVLSWNVLESKARGGVMVTASHNPAYFNGIKFKGPYGGPVESEETLNIEKCLSEEQIKEIDFKQGLEKGIIKFIDMDACYFKKITSYVDISKIKSSKFKVLVDSMFGAGKTYIQDFLKGGSLKIESLHVDKNPSFCGVNPEPIYHNLFELINSVKNNYDLGIATDGDADRVGIVDDEGNFIFPHELIAMLACYLNREKGLTGSIVKSISTTAMIDKVGKDLGCKVIETPIGFKHICEIMRKEDVLIGGEESGGIGYKNYMPERDGILSGLLILEMMTVYNKKLSVILKELREKYGRLYYDRIDIKYDKNIMLKILNKIKILRQDEILGKKVKEIKDFDGVKHIFEDGSWLLIRASGTEPVLRIYAESFDKKMVKNFLDEGKKLMFG